MVEVVNSVEALTQKMNEMKAAQREFATYSQEQVDKIFFAAAMAANAARIPLAKQAVAETGMGIVEDKVIKNHYASEYIFSAVSTISKVWSPFCAIPIQLDTVSFTVSFAQGEVTASTRRSTISG